MAIDIATGNIWDDFTSAVSDVTSSIVSKFDDITNVIPGAAWVKSTAGGALKDFANTTVGMVVLRALASTMYGPLAPILGPQVASLAWALPGLIKGEPFDQAWLTEFAHRVEQTGQILGAGPVTDQVIGPLKETCQQLLAQAQATGLPIDQALQQLNVTPEQLAAQLGIRTDVAAMALELVKKQKLYDLDLYDLATGRISTAAVQSRLAQNLGTQTMLQQRAMGIAQANAARLAAATTSQSAMSQRTSFLSNARALNPQAAPTPMPVRSINPDAMAAMQAAEQKNESSKLPLFLGAVGVLGLIYWASR